MKKHYLSFVAIAILSVSPEIGKSLFSEDNTTNAMRSGVCSVFPKSADLEQTMGVKSSAHAYFISSDYTGLIVAYYLVMLTVKQKAVFINSLKAYKKKYIIKKYADLDESATRLMINSFLIKVLGYKELEEIKTEYSINGTYADYVIQFDKKQHLVIEVKAIQINISEKHIRQAIGYAANEGINWVLLTNGRCFTLFRVIFGKPIRYKEIFNYDLSDSNDFKFSMIYFEYLTIRCVRSGELEKFWQRFIATEPENLSKYLYKPEIIKFLKRSLKKDAKLKFSEEGIFESIHEIIINPIKSKKPKFKR